MTVMSLKSPVTSRTETYSYLTGIAPSLLRPYLKAVMEHTAIKPQKSSTASSPVIRKK
jgi:hypothetical protein